MKNEQRKWKGFKNLAYILNLMWHGDKGTILYTLYKNIAEEIFYVFFFVYLTQYIYTCIQKKTPFINLFWMVCLGCSIHIVVHFVAAGHAYYLKCRTPDVYKYIFGKVIDKSSDIELARFEQPDFYDKFTRALDECLTRGFDTLNTFSFFLAYGISAILTMGVIVNVDPVMLVFVIPPIFGSFYFGSKKNKALYQLDLESTREKRVVNYTKRVFYEKKYASEIRLYGIKNILFKQHKDSYEKIYEITSKYRKKALAMQLCETLLFLAVAFFGSVLYIAFVIKTGRSSEVGAYLAMVTAISFATRNITRAIEQGVLLKKHDLYINNLKEFLEYKPIYNMNTKHPCNEDIPQTNETFVKMESIDSKSILDSIETIEFRNVSFTYEGAHAPVIKDLSLKINKGQRIALVGHNGAGKTTLIKLLMGLYQVTEGEILINGVNIQDFNSKDYHSHFGTVFQDLQIFSLPISENVLLRAPETEEDRHLILDSLQKAQFGDMIESLENGIDTMVSREFDENGVVLSGGQAQKLAIARVFAKNPDVVILDEPSSALDPIAEFNMYKNMMEVSKEKTVIFISHRLSSTRTADKVYMLENGQIIESGTHKDLMDLNESYARMFRLQAKNYQESLPKDMEVECFG